MQDQDTEEHYARPWQTWALRFLAVALVILAVLPGIDQGTESGAAETSALGTRALETADGITVEGTQDDTAEADISSPGPTPTALPAPLVINRVWSPAPGAAQVEGAVTDSAPPLVAVLVEGIPVATVELSPRDDGTFEFVVDGLATGPQTLCLDLVCSRVFVATEPDESAEDVETRISEAVKLAAARFDINAGLPGWQIEATGPNTGVDGYIDPDAKTIFISANPGRSVAEMTTTVLHELGHAVDATYMTEATRTLFRELRGHEAALSWALGSQVGGVESQDSSEDFAEVFVAWVTNGEHMIATTAIAPQPTTAELTAFCELVAIEGVSCGG